MSILPSFRLLSLAFALILLACSGGDSSTEPTPHGSSNTIAVHAGNNQTANVSSAVPVNPAVIVRNSQGAPVAGVRVDFTVDQGGGTISAASANTDQNGVATPGQWTLGPTAGTQALGAVYASQPKVTITATATAPTTVVLVSQTVSSSGGTIVVNKPGSALNGAKLQFDNGALPSATTVRLSERASAGFSLPAGYQALSPGLGISSNVARLNAGALVTLPATQVAGKLLFIGLRNPANGQVTLLPPASADANSISAVMMSLDASTVPASGIAAAIRGVQTDDDDDDLVVLLLGLDPALLVPDVSSDYRPGTDDWDFPTIPIAKLPFLPTIPSIDGVEGAIARDGLVTTSLWYFVNQRKFGGAPPLNGRFQEAQGQPLSNRRGIRWAAIAEGDVPDINRSGALGSRTWADWLDESPAAFAKGQFLGIKALMLTGFRMPVPVALLSTDGSTESEYSLGIAFRTEGNTIELAIPDAPGATFRATINDQGLVPFTVTSAKGSAFIVRGIAGIPYVSVVNDSRMQSQWARVVNNTIGDAEGWPKPKLHWEKAELDTANVYLLDALQHWWQCQQCPDVVTRPAPLPATANHVQRFEFVDVTTSTSGALGSNFSSVNISAAGLNDLEMRRMGYVVYHPYSQRGNEVAYGWLDWNTVTYRQLKLTPSVASIEFSKDTTITLNVTPSRTPPAGTKYRWLLRTDDKQDSVETNGPTHTRDLKKPTDGWLVFSALEGAEKRPIGRDSIRIKASVAAPYWRLTSISGPSDILEVEEGETDTDELRLLRRVIAAPNSGVITIETVGNVRELRLRALRSALWNANDCCPLPVRNPSTEWLLPLGFDPPVNWQVGPFFAGWGSSNWSQTTEALDAGTMTGQWVPGTFVVNVKDGGQQLAPQGGIRFTATRNGNTMTGEISLYVWWIDEASGKVEEGPEIFHYPFTAVRMK